MQCFKLLNVFALSSIMFCMEGGGGFFYAAYGHSATVLQQNICKGKVIDESGRPIIGASIIIKGTKTGTISDIEGCFSLGNMNKGQILEISCIGYETAEVIFKDNNSSLQIIMKEDSKLLDEVVVTALGMKREKKALGYAITELKGESLNANAINPVSALQGKVAGVQITQSDGGLFGSNKILIRGASTLNKNNQPIYVVDGIILDNSIHEGSADWNPNSQDFGNELKNLNPQDFETVTVLKGAAATALYGSRGMNGAVVITTKGGQKSKGLGIQVSQSVGFDVITQIPRLQNSYGEGTLSGYVDIKGQSVYNNLAFFINDEGKRSIKELAGSFGWGPTYDNMDIIYFDGSVRPYKAHPDNYRRAYRTGINNTTNVAITGGNDKTSFYASIGYKYATGTTFNNTFERLNLLTKASHKITDKVNLEAGLAFANSKPRNAQINIGEYFINTTFSRSYDIADKMKYKGEHGGIANTQYGDKYGNLPGKSLWWHIFENNFTRKETSVRPNLKLTMEITPWMTSVTEASLNYYFIRFESKMPGEGYENEGGSYALGNETKEQTNFNTSLNFHKQFGDFEVHGFLRGEYYQSFVQSQSMSTNGGLVARNKFFINNSVKDISYSGIIGGEKKILSVAYQAGFSWKDMIFADITGRQDRSSALVYADGHGTYSYFYPSVSGSWIVSNSFKKHLPQWISFAKIRGSWAQVGNDTDPYIINPSYILNTATNNTEKIYGKEISNTAYSSNLRPERKNSIEFGIDWRFFENRIGIDATYYKENTTDQIMKIEVPEESGIKHQYINAGNIQNSGVEIALNTVPVRKENLEWNLNFTYTRNRSKIISLHKNVANYIELSGSPSYGNFRVGSVAKVGGEYGLLLTDSAIEKDPVSGMNVIDYHPKMHAAYYVRSGNVQTMGSINPDFLGSLSSSLRYKNLTVSVSLDARFGGYVASYGSHYGTAYGFTAASLKYRDKAHGGVEYTSRWDNLKYEDGVIPDGIFKTGTKISQPDGTTYIVKTGQFSSGETFRELSDKKLIDPTHANNWHYINNKWVYASTKMGVVTDEWFTKLNYIALRDVTISYTLPSKFVNKIGAKGLTLSASGHNLCYLLNTMPNGENPESVRGTAAHEFRIRSFDGVTANFIFSINASF